jgi:hypothetical protein
MAVLFAAARGVYDSGRNMHAADGKAFEALKKKYSKASIENPPYNYDSSSSDRKA